MNLQCIEAAREWEVNEIRRLTDLLRTERRIRGGMAFKCQDSACCNFGHWVNEGSCDCYHHQRVEHDAAVDRALGIRGARKWERCAKCGGALPVTGRNDAMGECSCVVVADDCGGPARSIAQ